MTDWKDASEVSTSLMRWISGQFWENSITDLLVLKIRLTTSMIGLGWTLDEGRDFELSKRSLREFFCTLS